LDEPLDEDEEDTNEWEMIHYSAGTTEHEVKLGEKSVANQGTNKVIAF
jgi:hypothetical protein